MKIIKYGPGWTPQTLTCGSCKSELEYTDTDVGVRAYSDYDCNPLGETHYVVCPICGLRNIIKRVDYDE